MSDLRSRLIRLAHANPNLRPDILPLITGDRRTASTVHVAAKDTMDFVTWALRTQRPLPIERVIGFLERNGVVEAVGSGESKRGQPLGEGEYVEVQANNAPGDLIDLLRPFHLQRGKIIKVDGADIVIRFDGTDDTLRVPGGTVSGKASGVYRASIAETTTGMRLIEVVYLPANERKPAQVSIEVLREYVEKGMSAGEDRSENYFSGYVPSWKTSKDGNPYFMVWTQQRGGRPRTLSPMKGQVYYIGLANRRPGNWEAELAQAMNAV